MDYENGSSDGTAALTAHVGRIHRLLVGIFLILLVMALFFAKDVFLPIILGVLLSLTLSPIVRGLSRLGVPAALSAIVLILGLGGGMFTTAYLMSGPVSAWVNEAPDMGEQLKRKLRGVNETVEGIKKASEEVEEIATTSASKDVQKVSIEQPGLLNTAVTSFASVVTSSLVALVLALFLLASDDLFYGKIVASFGRFSDKKRALRVVYDIERKVSRYLLTITLINAGLGLAVATALSVFGLPNAYIWGVVAFLLNFLPFIGAMGGVLLVAIYSIVTYDSLSYAMIAPGLYLILTAIEGQIVTPTVLGRRLELNTVSVFLTVVFWGWLWGIAGALMAVPFLVLVKVVCDNVESLQTFGSFLGARSMAIRDEEKVKAQSSLS